MGFFTNLLAGGLGWSIAGPLGAVIGVVVASMFSRKTSVTTVEHEPRAAQNDFKMALIVLITAVMKADGVIKKSELSQFKKIWSEMFGEQQTLEALQVVKSLMNQEIDAAPVARQCAANLQYSARLELIHLLFLVAAADNDIDLREKNTILLIANNLRISNEDYLSIEAMFSKIKSSDWAYKVLQIEETATDEEVKKAYRLMAMKYHPDKVNGLGDEVKEKATEKFRQVKEAYDAIKKIRGMV